MRMAYLARTTFLQFGDIHFSPRVLLAVFLLVSAVASLAAPIFSFLSLALRLVLVKSAVVENTKLLCFSSTLPPSTLFSELPTCGGHSLLPDSMDANECIPSHCFLSLPEHHHHHHHHHHLTRLSYATMCFPFHTWLSLLVSCTLQPLSVLSPSVHLWWISH